MGRRRTYRKPSLNKATSPKQTTPQKQTKQEVENWPTPICENIKVSTPNIKSQQTQEKLRNILDKCPCDKTEVPNPDCQIECSQCKQWWHSHCANLTPHQAKLYCKHNIYYSCFLCTAKNLSWNKHLLERINNIANQKVNPQSTSDIREPSQPKSEIHSEEHIIIIDKVDKSVKNSAEIKSNLKKSGSTIPINYAYTLPKGGIAIHTDIKNKDRLTKAIGKSFPNSIQHQPFIKQQKQKVVIRGVRPHITEEELKTAVETSIKAEVEIHRFCSKSSGRPFPIISILTDVTSASSLLNQGIYIFGKHYNVVRYLKPVIRCHNCQLYGHISKFCTNSTVCTNCGDSDCSSNCTKPSKCHNCSGNHPANSNLCPTYIAKRSEIQKHFENVHNKNSSTEHSMSQYI